jgi:hypothetical protein
MLYSICLGTVQYVVFIPPLHPTPPPPAHRCNNPYCLTVLYSSISSLNYNVAPRKIMFFTVHKYCTVHSHRLYRQSSLPPWGIAPALATWPSLLDQGGRVWTAIRISSFGLFCLGLADLLVLFASVPFAGVLLISFPPRFSQATHSSLLRTLLLSPSALNPSCCPLALFFLLSSCLSYFVLSYLNLPCQLPFSITISISISSQLGPLHIVSGNYLTSATASGGPGIASCPVLAWPCGNKREIGARVQKAAAAKYSTFTLLL